MDQFFSRSQSRDDRRIKKCDQDTLGGAMMNLRKYEKILRDLFRDPLAVRGFSPRGTQDVVFVREKADIAQLIVFSSRYEYRTESHKFDFAVADRYLALHRLLHPTEGDRFLPNVALPIHLLRPEGQQFYREWYLMVFERRADAVKGAGRNRQVWHPIYGSLQ